MSNVKNIVLDFGHGGVDATGEYTTAPAKMHKFDNGETAYEGLINRQIGKVLLELFEKDNYNIVCTVAPSCAEDVSLRKRVKVANSFSPRETIFISIHSNASITHRGRGFEIYTSRGETKADVLATCIADEVEKLYHNLSLKLRYDFTDGDKDKEADFYVLRKTKCPAVLIECLFFDNMKDFKFLRSEEFQKSLAKRIYKGVQQYIKKDLK